MSEASWSCELDGRDAAAICAALELEEPAQELLAQHDEPQAYFNALLEGGHLPDAVRFMATTLPQREAVWWAYLCVSSTAEAGSIQLAAKDQEALQLAEEWVREPDDDKGRLAFEVSQGLEFQTPASWVAVGAHWSGSTLGPPEIAAIPPGADLTGKAVSGALMLCAASSVKGETEKRLQSYLNLGSELACGERLWEESRP